MEPVGVKHWKLVSRNLVNKGVGANQRSRSYLEMRKGIASFDQCHIQQAEDTNKLYLYVIREQPW